MDVAAAAEYPATATMLSDPATTTSSQQPNKTASGEKVADNDVSMQHQSSSPYACGGSSSSNPFSFHFLQQALNSSPKTPTSPTPSSASTSSSSTNPAINRMARRISVTTPQPATMTPNACQSSSAAALNESAQVLLDWLQGSFDSHRQLMSEVDSGLAAENCHPWIHIIIKPIAIFTQQHMSTESLTTNCANSFIMPPMSYIEYVDNNPQHTTRTQILIFPPMPPKISRQSSSSSSGSTATKICMQMLDVDKNVLENLTAKLQQSLQQQQQQQQQFQQQQQQQLASGANTPFARSRASSLDNIENSVQSLSVGEQQKSAACNHSNPLSMITSELLLAKAKRVTTIMWHVDTERDRFVGYIQKPGGTSTGGSSTSAAAAARCRRFHTSGPTTVSASTSAQQSNNLQRSLSYKEAPTPPRAAVLNNNNVNVDNENDDGFNDDDIVDDAVYYDNRDSAVEDDQHRACSRMLKTACHQPYQLHLDTSRNNEFFAKDTSRKQHDMADADAAEAADSSRRMPDLIISLNELLIANHHLTNIIQDSSSSSSSSSLSSPRSSCRKLSDGLSKYFQFRRCRLFSGTITIRENKLPLSESSAVTGGNNNLLCRRNIMVHDQGDRVVLASQHGTKPIKYQVELAVVPWLDRDGLRIAVYEGDNTDIPCAMIVTAESQYIELSLTWMHIAFVFCEDYIAPIVADNSISADITPSTNKLSSSSMATATTPVATHFAVQQQATM